MIQIRLFTATDSQLGMHLKSQAGWNQTEADWRRVHDLQADGCFVAELDGAPVGTAATCIFGPVAWIALVLVDAAVRGHGVGTALMRHALAFLEQQGVRSVRLDATPLGRPIYEKLGFAAQFPLARYGGTLPHGDVVPEVESARAEDWEPLRRLDRTITATDRRKLLDRLFTERPDDLRLVRHEGQVEGFLTARPGARALHIGPCLVTTETAGRRLFADARCQYAGRQMYIDIPDGNAPAVDAARAMGLTVQRPLLRMCRGEPVLERIEQMWATTGPEKG
jgi:GNAT superfamily N-acetyltransferase